MKNVLFEPFIQVFLQTKRVPEAGGNFFLRTTSIHINLLLCSAFLPFCKVTASAKEMTGKSWHPLPLAGLQTQSIASGGLYRCASGSKRCSGSSSGSFILGKSMFNCYQHPSSVDSQWGDFVTIRSQFFKEYSHKSKSINPRSNSNLPESVRWSPTPSSDDQILQGAET